MARPNSHTYMILPQHDVSSISNYMAKNFTAFPRRLRGSHRLYYKQIRVINAQIAYIQAA